jgi:phospholipase/carboxylesterase
MGKVPKLRSKSSEESGVTEFVHRFVPGARPDGPALLLLHGTGGNEDDLLPLGDAIAPGAPRLSPRGPVLEHGMPRFFRRLAEGVFDLEDLRRRTDELADFVVDARRRYDLGSRPLIAVGFSNGANIAAAMLLLRPESLSGGVLFRPMVPLVPESLPSLPGTPVFLAAGRNDPIVPPDQPEALARLLRQAGATVLLHWSPAAHNLVKGDVDAGAAWLADRFGLSSLPPTRPMSHS